MRDEMIVRPTGPKTHMILQHCALRAIVGGAMG